MKLLLKNELDGLKRDIQKEKGEQFTRLLEQCKWYSEQKLSVEHPPTTITYIGMGSANLSLTYLLTGQKQYFELAKHWIFTAVNYDVWGYKFLVDVDLSASWLLYGLGLSYSWLKDDLNPEERKLLLDKLILQGNKIFRYGQENKGNCWSTDYWQNHNWINYSGLLTAAYAIKDEYKEASVWIKEIVENFKYVLDVMPEDGSNYEGTGYWRYSVNFFLTAAELIRDFEGIDLFQTGYLKNTFWYKLYQTAPNMEENINFSDVHDTRSSHSVAAYYKLASEYHNEYAQWLGEEVRTKYLFREAYQSKLFPGIMPEAFLELIWYNPEIKRKAPDDLPLTRFWPDLGLAVIRSGWDRDSIHFSFKASAPGGNIQWKESWKLNRANNWRTRSLTHYHVDFNHFILKAFDSSLAIDEGFHRTSKAEVHSLITVDGLGCLGEEIWNQGSLSDPELFDLNSKGIFNVWRDVPEDAVASIEHYSSGNGYTYVVGESSKLYDRKTKLTRNARNVLYSELGYFIIFDELESEESHTYTWHMQSEQFAREIRKNDFEIANGKGVLNIYSSATTPVAFSTKETVLHEIMTPQRPTDVREIVLRTFLVQNEQKVGNMVYINVLAPRSAFGQEFIKVKRIHVEDLVGVEIIGEDFEETFLFSQNGILVHKDINEEGKWISVVKRNGKVVKKALYQPTHAGLKY